MAETLEPSDPVEELLPDEIPDLDPNAIPDELPDLTFDDIEADAPRPFGKSWAFDFVAERFLPTPGSGPSQTNGYDTIRFWIEKALRTERGAAAVHGPQYGIEGPYDVIGSAGDNPDTALLLNDRVEDALLFHPKIAEVRDFEAVFDETEEALNVSFTVVLDDDSEIPVTNFPVQ